MSSDLVSVCIITYNHKNFIKQCIESVLFQKTEFPVEIIIGDDCSTDGTTEIVRQMQSIYPDVIKAVYHSPNVGGVNNAYKYCYPMLKGKYVAVCEGDDFWTDPYKLQKQIGFLAENPSYILSFHRVNNVDENNNVLESQSELPEPILYDGEEVFHLSIPTLSIVFKKCFDAVPSELFEVRSCDTFLCGLLATYGKAVDMGFVGASYRTHPGGVYSSKKFVDRVKQGIKTRRIMKRSPAFSSKYKIEIEKEILKRKVLYFKYFMKKKQLLNSFKIAVA